MNALIDEGRLLDRDTNRQVFSYAHPLFWRPGSSSVMAAIEVCM
jgi:hypothetical protein